MKEIHPVILLFVIWSAGIYLIQRIWEKIDVTDQPDLLCHKHGYVYNLQKKHDFMYIDCYDGSTFSIKRN